MSCQHQCGAMSLLRGSVEPLHHFPSPHRKRDHTSWPPISHAVAISSSRVQILRLLELELGQSYHFLPWYESFLSHVAFCDYKASFLYTCLFEPEGVIGNHRTMKIVYKVNRASKIFSIFDSLLHHPTQPISKPHICATPTEFFCCL